MVSSAVVSVAMQSAPLLERRIIELLTTTNLTFKEIILKLDGEQLQASIGIIRRINRDNRYRRPRYDSKLTPAQRDSLVEELRYHQGVKPNLSLLAKRYGVCHGSVWYWWDKLNRIRRTGSGAHLRAKDRLFKRSIISPTSTSLSSASSPSSSSSSSSSSMSPSSSSSGLSPAYSSWLEYPHHELIGRVRVVAMSDVTSYPIELPILMFTKTTEPSFHNSPTVLLQNSTLVM